VLKSIICIIISIILGCCHAYSKELNITVTTLPQKLFVEKIGDKLVKINVMVDKGNDPHTYEPKPSKMIALSESDLYFTISLPLEKLWIEKVKGSNRKLKIVAMDSGIEKLISEGQNEDVKHHDLQADPHTWLSPSRVRIMAENIMDALIRVDISNREIYWSNFLNFVKEINAIDSKIADIFLKSKKNQSTFMVYHPSFLYFAKSYGLNQIAIEFEGKEPPPKHLQSIIETAKKERINKIFIEPQLDKKSAYFIAKSIDAKLIEIDPLSYMWGANLIKLAEFIASNE
jgi:zinc transport system substrate-binding protein